MSMICYTHIRCGVWRSLVARTAGGREVMGSNPISPMFLFNRKGFWTLWSFGSLFVLFYSFMRLV